MQPNIESIYQDGKFNSRKYQIVCERYTCCCKFYKLGEGKNRK